MVFKLEFKWSLPLVFAAITLYDLNMNALASVSINRVNKREVN